MPLYDFECEDCNARVELLIRGAEKPVCSECGSERVRQLLSVPAAPRSNGASLPIANDCDPSLPPCNPMCCRLDH